MKEKANNILWVEHWIQNMDPELKNYEVWASELQKGKWECEIDLPLIGFVNVKANTQVEAMLQASEKAAEMINSFMEKHPEIDIKNIYKDVPYKIESDSEGRFIKIQVNSEYREKESERIKSQMQEAIQIMKEAVQKLNKVYEDQPGLHIQVLDKTLFKGKRNITEVHDEIWDNVETNYHCSLENVCFIPAGDCVILIGHTSPLEESENN